MGLTFFLSAGGQGTTTIVPSGLCILQSGCGCGFGWPSCVKATTVCRLLTVSTVSTIVAVMIIDTMKNIRSRFDLTMLFHIIGKYLKFADHN